MGKRLLLPLFLLFIAIFSVASTLELDYEEGHEVVARIAAHDVQAKSNIIKELVDLGFGPECPKSNQSYVEVKLPEIELMKLQHLASNLTIVEDPTKEEFLRFLESSRSRGKRGERAIDPNDLYKHYHDQNQISNFLDEIVLKCPNIARKYSIGKTFLGAELWAIRITDNPEVNEVGEVEFQYIANMHGDEVVGRELSLYFIYHLCDQYHQPRIKAIVDNTDIHILPTMNPDGFAGGRRANGRRKDLNRNFPDQFDPTTWGRPNPVSPLPPLGTGSGAFVAPVGNFEPEVVAVMQWMGDHNFALAANYHGGSVVANYPFDGNRQRESGRYAPSPDDLLYRQLARVYAANSQTMSGSREFPSGITNGADWYVLYGGMQDYAYLWHGTLHITVELSDEKWPAKETLISFWNDNRESMLAYLEQTKYRVWGVVTDCATKAPITVGTVIVEAESCHSANCRMQAVKLDRETGDYHRIMPRPSATTNYVFTASSSGYAPVSHSVAVGPSTALPHRLDFCLNKAS